jgi:transposase-like protein
LVPISRDPVDPSSLLDDIRRASLEMKDLGDMDQQVRAYRLDLVRRAKAGGARIKDIAEAAGVTTVAVTQWLRQ